MLIDDAAYVRASPAHKQLFHSDFEDTQGYTHQEPQTPAKNSTP